MTTPKTQPWPPQDPTMAATRPAPKDHTTDPQTNTGAHDPPTSILRPTHNQSIHTTPPRVRTGIKTNSRTLDDESEHSHTKERGDVHTAWSAGADIVKRPRVWCVSSQLDVKLLSEGVESVEHWGRSLDLTTLEVVIIPINHPGVGNSLAGGHWTVLIIRIEEGVIQAVNSTGAEITDSETHPHRHMIQRTVEWLQHVATEHKLTWEATWRVEHLVRTRQLDEYNCGVHVLLNAMGVFDGLWITNGRVDMGKARVWIYKVICRVRDTETTPKLRPVAEESDDCEVVEAVEDGRGVSEMSQQDTAPAKAFAGHNRVNKSLTSVASWMQDFSVKAQRAAGKVMSAVKKAVAPMVQSEKPSRAQGQMGRFPGQPGRVTAAFQSAVIQPENVRVERSKV